MKIRAKLTVIDALLVLGVTLAISVVIFFTNSIIALKDFEVLSERVLSNLDQISTRTGSLLTTNSRITIEQAQLQLSIDRFEQLLREFRDARAVRFLGKNQSEALSEAVGWWRQISDWYYTPALKHIDSMIDKRMDRLVGDRGLFQTYLMILQSGEGDPFIADYQTLKNYQLLITENTLTFRERMQTLISEIRIQTEATIISSTRWAIGIVALSLLVTFILTSRFSSLMARRIKKVGEAMRVISRGDFSNELDIRSRDEFEELSLNYNALKNQLKEKLDSVLDFMFRIGSLQAQGANPEEVLALVVESAVENTEADAGALFLVDEESHTIYVSEIIGLFPPPFPFPDALARKKQAVDQLIRNHTLKLGESAIGECIEKSEARFFRQAAGVQELEGSFRTLSEHDPLHLSSLILVPLALPGRMLGAIAVAMTSADKHFSDLDFTHMRTFADYAALTIDSIYNYAQLIGRREIQREIEIAANIQKDLLPKRIPEIKNVKIAAFSEAAKGVSGDYYDVFPLGAGRTAVVICDVVGKGVPAAMLMVMIRTILRLSASGDRMPSQILTFLNKGITGKIGVDHFATMGMFVYDENSRLIYFSNAAHHPLLIYRGEGGEFIELDTPGLPIGIEENERYTQRQFQTGKGDILIFYTDGLTETRSRDGREYGLEALKSVVRTASSLVPNKIAERIRDDLLRFSEGTEQHDDQTFLVMKIHG
jgi:HAMP domain-containing protein